MSHARLVPFALLAAGVTPALAQSDIDDTDKWSWAENVGWMNWRDADDAAQGVGFHDTFLSGFIWCENVGWINTGDGTPVSAKLASNPA